MCNKIEEMVTDIHLYTDCSGQFKYGVSGLLVEYTGLKGQETSWGYSKSIDEINEDIKSEGQASISVGEMYAILLGLSKLGDTNGVKVSVYTDNLHCFNLLNGVCKPKRENLKKMIEMIDYLKTIHNIEIMWIKAHVGTWGSEIVDDLAKRARFGSKYNPNYGC